MTTFKIDDSNMDVFFAKFNRLCEIATKINATIPTYEIVETEKYRHSDGSYSKINHVRINADVKINGFHFVAKFDHTEKVVFAHEKIPSNFDIEKCNCDHCGVNRFRLTTYIIKDGEKYMQVGGSCLINYVGHKFSMNVLPDAFATIDDIMNSDYGTGERRYDIREIIRFAIVSVRRRGYSKSSADYSTADDVKSMMLDFSIGKQSVIDDYSAVTTEEVREHIEFVRNSDDVPIGSFMFNLKNIFNNQYCTLRTMAIAVAVVPSLAFAKQKRVTNENTKVSNFVGEEKQKLTDIQVSIMAVSVYDSYYGTNTMIKMIDATGNIFVWFASGVKNYESGDEFMLSGTVKTHDLFKGTKQTVLTRCKLTQK